MTVKAVNSTVTLSVQLNTALALPNGARFYRCGASAINCCYPALISF